MKFSRRVPGDLRPNTLARLRSELGEIPYDLTQSNPTLCGIAYASSLLPGLSRPEGLIYQPEARGLEGARQAVAREYDRRGRRVDAEAIVLTASTSEAYGWLFKLLCEPGDAVLVPVPSYPLLAHLAALEGIRALPYRLDPSERWQPDLPRALAEPARALISVHPSNPVGAYIGVEEMAALVKFCAREQLALIADEVFLDYPLTTSLPVSFVNTVDMLTFTLGGLSKHVGLPQLKLAWIVVSGPADLTAQAMERLAFIADQYLSVATPVQLALDDLLQGGAVVRSAILERCRSNLQSLQAVALPAQGIDLILPQGGWSAVLRYPHVIEEEELALQLLEKDGVAIYPGYFFDFPEPGYLTLSLLPPRDVFSEGVERVVDRIAQRI